MSNKINEILSDENKQVNRASGVLARLFRQISLDIGLEVSNFNRLLTAHINRVHGGEKKHQQHYKNNLVSALTSNNISLKTFIRFINLLNPEGFKITIELKWRDGSITSHSVEADVVDTNPEGFNNEDD